MKSLLKSNFLAYLTILLFNTQIVAQEISQCDIGIDQNNTHLTKNLSGNYELRSIIHHPFGGNDDAAADIYIQIQIPHRSQLLGEITFNQEAIEGTIEFIEEESYPNFPNYFVYKISFLQRYEHVDLHLNFSNPCAISNHYDRVFVSTWPTRPVDFISSNNTWSKKIECAQTLHLINQDILQKALSLQNPDFQNQKLIELDICAIIDCIELKNMRWKEKFVFPNELGFKFIELRKKGKIVTKAKYNKQTKVFYLPNSIDINKENINDFTFSFGK